MTLPKLPAGIHTPAYVLDAAALKRNVATAARIKRETGAKILLATKAWAMPAAFQLIRDSARRYDSVGRVGGADGSGRVRQGGACLCAGLHRT